MRRIAAQSKSNHGMGRTENRNKSYAYCSSYELLLASLIHDPDH